MKTTKRDQWYRPWLGPSIGLVVALVLGLIVSVFQAVTQIQEQTLAFVPKLLGVAGVFLLALPWILQTLTIPWPACDSTYRHRPTRPPE